MTAVISIGLYVSAVMGKCVHHRWRPGSFLCVCVCVFSLRNRSLILRRSRSVAAMRSQREIVRDLERLRIRLKAAEVITGTAWLIFYVELFVNDERKRAFQYLLKTLLPRITYHGRLWDVHTPFSRIFIRLTCNWGEGQSERDHLPDSSCYFLSSPPAS